MLEVALWTLSFILAALFAFAAVIFWPRRVIEETPMRRRELAIFRLLDRLQPGDRIILTEKRGRPLGKRGGTETVFLGRDHRGRMRCRTTPLSTHFHREPGDLVRLVA